MTDAYQLTAGPHRRPGGARCAMEWVAYLAGEPHTDAPASVSPVLAAFARSRNDALDDHARQRLRPYLARMIGTAGDGRDEWRAWLCAGWLARACVPALLDHAGLTDHARSLGRGEATMHAARAAAARRRAEARGAAMIADGPRHATRAVCRAAGWEAARAAVRAAAPDPERAAIVDAACQTARDASWVAAWRDPTNAWEDLRAIADALQRSSFHLLHRLLPGDLLDPDEAGILHPDATGRDRGDLVAVG